jgi:hypothetical protein
MASGSPRELRLCRWSVLRWIRSVPVAQQHRPVPNWGAPLDSGADGFRDGIISLGLGLGIAGCLATFVRAQDHGRVREEAPGVIAT